MKIVRYKRVLTIFIIIAILITKFFILDVARVQGDSMNPTLKNNDLLLYSKISNNYSRFDIVIIKIDNKYYIKRIIGLPGETIEYKDNKLLVNKELVKESFDTTEVNDFSLNQVCSYEIIPQNKYLVLGDNRANSYDSRNFGLVDISSIKGKIIKL